MKELNEYQKRNEAAYDITVEKLQAIVDELKKYSGPNWALIPPDRTLDHTPRFVCISNGTLGILAERGGYSNKDRWRFFASEWPKTTNETGRKESVTPSNLYDPKERRPETTAAENRDPKAIAKQIANKIISDYQRIYARCEERAAGIQKHYDSRAAAMSRLAKACGDDNRYQTGRSGHTYYVRNLPGDTVGVEFNSEGDVKIRLNTDEMIEVLALLRQLRQSEAA